MDWGDVQEKPVPKLTRATRDFQVYQPVLMDEYLEEGAHCGSADFCPMECTNYGIVDLPDDAENIDADFTGVIRIDRSGIVFEWQ